MTQGWDVSDEEMEQWLDEWQEVDRASADYLAERVPEIREEPNEIDSRWLSRLADTISPVDEPEDDEDIEGLSSVMALDHADWLGLAMGVVRHGPGVTIDAEFVRAACEALDDVEGEIDDPNGYAQIVSTALLHLEPLWRELGVLDQEDLVTERGAWGLPRAVHRIWTRASGPNTDE